jgi:hypothetical protein
MTAEISSNGFASGVSEVSSRASLKSRARSKAAPRAKARPKARAGVIRRKAAATPLRTSEILRGLLEKNKAKSLTVRNILSALGPSSFGTSLMVFSIPEVLPIPVPGVSAIVVIPSAIVSAQMTMGRKEITLPKWLLKRSIPRKAFAAAIRAMLPILERLERTVKPRWTWMTSRVAKRFLGAYVLFLEALMALPIPGTNMPLAIAVFVIGLGLVERDGAMITAGILIGLAATALLGGIFAGLVAIFRAIFGQGA